MQIAESVKHYLDGQNISYDLIQYSENKCITQAASDIGTSAEHVVRAVIFQNDDSAMMVVLPASYILDVDTLGEKTQRHLEPTEVEDNNAPFPGLAPQRIVPLSKAYQLPVLLDQSLKELEEFYFSSGTLGGLVKVGKVDFHSMQMDIRFENIAFPMTKLEAGKLNSVTSLTHKRIEQRLEDIEGLPAMPEMAQRILQVSKDEHADANDLAKVIEVDPSLAAQIISYATSAFYAFRGEITTVREAIARVLGFELVANIAIGIAIGRSFNISPDGPLGLNHFWRHAIYCAALAERLAKMVSKEKAIRPGLAYLCGLLHDFGHLLLGHVFPPGFTKLNQFVLANPEVSVVKLESMLLGISHEEIGAQLLHKWKMPEETVFVARRHHDQEYTGEYMDYIHLVLIVDRLLCRYEIGDATDCDLPASSLESLGLTEQKVLSALNPLLETCVELDQLAERIAS
jgi:putative nucleotidyltransferase with HDIG domain